MKVLLVKTSSLGDVVHAMPAITEAMENVPGLMLNWVVEEGFADIARAHPSVDRVIPVAIRRWRRNLPGALGEIRHFLSTLRSEQYDLVVDSQGLLKSALVAAAARGPVTGFDRSSAREGAASWLYRRGVPVNPVLHAVHRQKQLLAGAFGYSAETTVRYGLESDQPRERRIMLFHGTTWPSKEWPTGCWEILARQVREAGFEPVVPAGNAEEHTRAQHILAGEEGQVLDRLPLAELMEEIRRCAGVVAVDTGLGHLAPALGVPVVGLFGATDPSLTGMVGEPVRLLTGDNLPCIPCRKRTCKYQETGDSSSIYPPCFEPVTPGAVWQTLQDLMASRS